MTFSERNVVCNHLLISLTEKHLQNVNIGLQFFLLLLSRFPVAFPWALKVSKNQNNFVSEDARLSGVKLGGSIEGLLSSQVYFPSLLVDLDYLMAL